MAPRSGISCGKLLRENEEGTRDLTVRVASSAGTYIRTLAEDFGKQLGLGAHLAELRRTRAGSFKITEANTLEQLSELAESGSLSISFTRRHPGIFAVVGSQRRRRSTRDQWTEPER